MNIARLYDSSQYYHFFMQYPTHLSSFVCGAYVQVSVCVCVRLCVIGDVYLYVCVCLFVGRKSFHHGINILARIRSIHPKELARNYRFMMPFVRYGGSLLIGSQVGLIVIASRHYGPSKANQIAHAASRWKEQLCGFDFANAEDAYPVEVRHFLCEVRVEVSHCSTDKQKGGRCKFVAPLLNLLSCYSIGLR